MSVFGPMITGTDVRRAVEATLRTWFPDHLGEMSARSGRARGVLPVPRSYVFALEMETFAADQLPAVVVVAPGLAEPPVRHGNGVYDATWSVGVGVAVSGQTRDQTLGLAEAYARVAQSALSQHGSLGGFATSTRWVDERYDVLDTGDLRTIGMTTVGFEVTVEGVVDAQAGLLAPTADATVEPPDRATVTSVPLSVIGEP